MSGTNVFSGFAHRRSLTWDRGVAGQGGGFGATLSRLWQLAGHIASVRASRRQLAEMDARMLADIGVSRADAVREAGRAIWDVRN